MFGLLQTVAAAGMVGPLAALALVLLAALAGAMTSASLALAVAFARPAPRRVSTRRRSYATTTTSRDARRHAWSGCYV